ncbi:MAG TPA: hypothetical protein VFD52_08770 [Clostridia bacterium]|nr:hypothetical protein [Clostridia bacterium]
MKNIILSNYEFILLTIAIVCTIIARLVNEELCSSKNRLFELITNAEKNYGGGTGALKKAAVVAEFSKSLSLLLKTFLGSNGISTMIEKALTHAKAVWAESGQICSYINSDFKQ